MEEKRVELIKKNIHMDRIRCKASSQITLEEDMNIPDSKPDVSTLVYDKGRVQIEEVKPTADHVTIRGRLLFHILYQSREDGQQLVHVEGKIPFEEQVYLEGVQSTDSVQVNWQLEDLTIGMINSRKLSIQALMTLKASVEELYDEELPVDLYQDGLEGESSVEYCKNPVELTQVAIQKNDIFRVKEEIALPANYPNILNILWDSVKLEDVEVRPLEEKLSIQGEIHVFVLYESEGEEQTIRAFETVLPLGGTLDCHGCRDNMIADISWEIGNQELDVRPDFDGEQRMLGLELVLDMGMKMYEEDRVEMLTDIYGVTKQVDAVAREGDLKKLLMKIGGKSKVNDHLRVKNSTERILQLLHSEGKVQVDATEITEDGIAVQGVVNVQVLYVTGDDSNPYNCIKGIIPFSYTMEVQGISPGDSYRLNTQLEQLQVAMLDSEELDVKGVLSFGAIVFQSIPATIISNVNVSPLDVNILSDLPGIVAYVVKPGDNLWNIGKRYYIPVAKIKEINGLSGDELRPGEKLLIVKGA